MPEVMQFDAEVSQQLEASYLTPEIVEQRRLQLAALDLMPGEHMLDIGSGPGLLAVQAAATVGASGSVHGIDPSEQMLAIAARRTEPVAGAAAVRFQAGDACALPFAAESFDAASGGPGVRVCVRDAGGVGRGVPGAAAGRAIAGGRHRLGLDRVALE